MAQQKQELEINWDEIEDLEEQAGGDLAAPKSEVEKAKKKSQIKKNAQNPRLAQRRI